MRAARSWSSQKPGSPIWTSNSARRAFSASGSKVITDPREAGSDLLELLLQRLRVLVGHGSRLAAAKPVGLEARERLETTVDVDLEVEDDQAGTDCRQARHSVHGLGDATPARAPVGR